MQKIFIDIYNKYDKIHDYYLDSYNYLVASHNITVILFSEKFKEKPTNKEQKKTHIYFYEYKDENELIKKIKELHTNSEVVFINTFTESKIQLIHQIKHTLGLPYFDNSKIFNNKSLQRQLLVSAKSGAKFINHSKNNYKDVSESLGIPFIIKPSQGVESSGVKKIYSESDFLAYKKENGLVYEEFIDGEMFSIDYYVDNNGQYTYSPAVQIELAEVLGIEDFFNFSRIVSNNTSNTIRDTQIKNLIEETIASCQLKNTFVHHEFKLTSKGVLKTIEINGRIGGYRLEIYKQSYGLHLLGFPFTEKQPELNLENNFCVIALYPERRCILQSYNYELLERIKTLPSFYSLRIIPEKYEGAEIGLTQDGFGKVGGINLKHNDYAIFIKDYNFIKENYKDLLITKI